MYKKFIKIMEKKLVKKIQMYNFQYLKKEKQFIGFYDEFVFRISFDTACYESKIKIHIEYNYPLVNNKLNIFPEYYMRYGFLGENENWNIEKSQIQHLDTIGDYVDDMQFIFENYFHFLISKVINTFELDYYIQQEYEILFNKYLEDIGEENPTWIYSIEFLSSGKSQDEWSEEDDEKCKELTNSFQDKNFPYEKIKTKILETIEHNKPIYREQLSEYFGDNTENIKIDKEIFPISLEELISENIIIKNTLDKFEFMLDTEIDLSEIQNFGETVYYKNNDYQLHIILKDGLFLEFILYYKNNSKRVNLYDGNYFWFGWLVGKESTRSKNIVTALNALEITLRK